MKLDFKCHFINTGIIVIQDHPRILIIKNRTENAEVFLAFILWPNKYKKH